MCDWVTWIKTVGLALSVIGGFASIMIFAISRFGAGVVWAPLYRPGQPPGQQRIVAFMCWPSASRCSGWPWNTWARRTCQ
jgi:hypothetical protein